MTVLDNTPRDQYTATGGQVAFSYTFEIAAEGDIAVLQNGVLLSLGAGAGEYAVTGVGSDTGGVVTLVTGATSGDIITFYRDMALERLTSYTNGGDFLAADVNNDYDRLWLALQQNTGTSNRALVAPNTDPIDINMTIPDKATRLGKYLKFNDTTGNPEAGSIAGAFTAAGMNHYNFTGDGTTVNFTLGMEPGGENNTQVYIDGVYQQKDGYNVSGAVVQFSVAPPNLSTIEVMVIEVLPVGATTASQVSFTQAGSATARNVQLKLQESISAADFGAVNDGITDNTAAVQAALDAAGGELVHVSDNTLFSLSSLTFPNSNFSSNNGRYSLSYLSNDDTSSPTQPGGNVTHERIFFQQNNNPSGYNNETQFASGYSTGLVVDVRRDVDAPNVGAGQNTEYGRTSVVWRQDGLNRVQLKYTDSAGDTSSPGLDDGWTAQFWEPKETLGNIKQSSFAATLVVNDMLKGSTSGARGWVKSIDASSTTVVVLSGSFVAGETVVLEPAQETTTDTISTVSSITYTSRSNRIGLSSKNNGNMFTNIQGDDAVYPFNVGGIVGIQQSNTTNGAFTNAEIILSDDFGNPTQQARMQLEASTGDIVFLNETTNLEVLRLENIGAGSAQSPYVRATTELQSTGASGTIRLGTAGANPVIQKGTGSPEGAVTAGAGSLYLNISGGSGTTLYVKESGSGNTGWVGK